MKEILQNKGKISKKIAEQKANDEYDIFNAARLKNYESDFDRETKKILKNNMPQISIIKKSDILKARRFDAEYFKPEYLKKIDKLKKNNFYLKDFLIKGNYGILPKSEDYNKGETFLIRGKNLRQISIEKSILIKVPSIYYNKKYDVQKNDILILVKGATIAFTDGVILVEENLNNYIFNGSVFRIRLNKKINPYFLYCFMSIRYFTFQKEREVANNGIEYNKLDTIKNYVIPNFNDDFQLQIEKIVKESHQKQTESKRLYKQAEQILLKELNLIDFEIKHHLTFTTTKKEIDEAKRFDSEYFQPKYEEIIKHIENYEGGFDVVKNIFNFKKGIEPGSEFYTKKGKDFVRVSDFSMFEIEDTAKKISAELFKKIKSDFQPKKGEILFTKDGTIGIASVLNKNLDGVLSSAFLRLTLRKDYLKFEKEYLALILNSVFCKIQVEKLSGGALIAHLKPSDFQKFKIPLIKTKIQKKIAEKITQSHLLRKESKELLELAKNKVEQAIEQEIS